MAIKTKQQEQQEKVMMGILFIIVIWAFLKYIYSPLGVKLEKAKQDLNTKNENVITMREQASSIDVMKQEYETLKLAVSDLEKKLPKEKEVPRFLRILSDNMKKYHIKFFLLKPEQIILNDYFDEVPFTIDVACSYHNLAKFLVAIGQLDRILVVKDLDLIQRSGETSGEDLYANLILATYIYKGE